MFVSEVTSFVHVQYVFPVTLVSCNLPAALTVVFSLRGVRST